MKREPTRYIVLVLLWVLPLAFKTDTEHIVDKYFVPLFERFQPSIFADGILFIVALYGIYLFISSKFKFNRHLDWWTIISISLLSFYFWIYRFEWFGFSHWRYSASWLSQEIYYVDIILAAPIALILYKLVPHTNGSSPIEGEYSLLDDSHIESIRSDELGRKRLAEFVAKHIVNTKSDRSFAIGINAKWGDGKTSFQFMLGEVLKESDPRIVLLNFNPWKSADESKIVQDFFELYSGEIRVYDARLGNRISRYGRKLLAGEGSLLLRLMGSFLVGSTNQEELFNEINEGLEVVNRKIVVFIDDLDRMSSREILEIVKLIRNSANFRNTFFVVGYDEEYVYNALGSHNDYGNTNFLEKIFQIQFDLSSVDESIIKRKLLESLVSRLPSLANELRSIINAEASPMDVLSSVVLGKLSPDRYINSILLNIRDVKRFVNYFALSVRLIVTEVVIRDYFYLSLLKFKFPLLIKELIRNEKNVFKAELNPFHHQKIDDKYIRRICEKLKMDEHDQDIVSAIFGFLYAAPKLVPERRSILHPENFPIYYENDLSSKRILYGEVVSLLERPWTEIEERVVGWINDGGQAALEGVLHDIDPLSNRDRFEKITRLWVILLNLEQFPDKTVSQWLAKISDSKQRLIAMYGDENLLAKYFRSLFDPENEYYFYTTFICKLILRGYIDKPDKYYFPLPKNAVEEIALSRLKRFIDSRSKFDTRVFWLFYYNCWSGKTDDDHVILMESASKLVLDYVKVFPIDYLRFVIRSKYGSHLDDAFVFEPFAKSYFGSWEEFGKFISEVASHHNEFVEMVQYFADFKQSGYEEFHARPIPKWIEVDNSGNASMKYYKDQTYQAFLTEISGPQNDKEPPVLMEKAPVTIIKKITRMIQRPFTR